MPGWNWILRGYYAEGVKPPKKAHQLAIEIGGMSKEALKSDLLALQARKDIGFIEGPYPVRKKRF